jgi:RNA-directed DNA polymerase
VVDLDLAKFFDRVHHQRLLARIADRVKDQRIIKLVHLMLKATVVMPDGTRVAVQEGTPQGGPLSPLLSNIVLNEMDGELARRGLRFVRYADDCNIFVRSERAGQRVMKSIRRFLEQRMRLQVNEEKSDVRKPDDVQFLGFRFRCAKEGDEIAILPSRKAEQRLKATMREMTPPNWGRSITTCMEEVSRYLTGWMSHFRLCTPDAIKGLGAIDAHIRRRIRAIIVRQKKRSRFLLRHLKAKGVSLKAAASCAYCGKGAWVKSNRPAMTRAYPPSWFTGRMASLTALWNEINRPQVSTQLSLAF